MEKRKFNVMDVLGEQLAGVADTMREIPVDDIRDNPRNFYPTPDPQARRALADSIRANGLLEPPTVVPAGDGTYRLISGHSRLAAIRSMWEDGTEEDWARVKRPIGLKFGAKTPAELAIAIVAELVDVRYRQRYSDEARERHEKSLGR